MMQVNDVELDIDIALQQAISSIGDKKNNILFSFGRIYQYADEPKFFQYFAKIIDLSEKKGVGHGTASGFSFFSQKLAALKCLLEALERYALKNYDPGSLVFAPSSSLKKPYLALSSIASFSDRQRSANPLLSIDYNGPFSWIPGKQLLSLKDAYIPAQLVYLSYRRKPGEGLLRLPISTGAASGTAYSASVYRGLCEIIERDAFMITYLNKLPRARVPLEKTKNEDIRKLLDIIKNYDLKAYSFDITTDLGIYSFLSVIYDKTGLAAAISTGLKSSLNPTEALLGSLQEAIHPRTWLRREKDNFSGNRADLMKPVELSPRGLLWSSLNAVSQLDFLLKSTTITKPIDEYKDESEKTSEANLRKTVTLLQKHGYDAYAVDITPNLPSLKNTKFNVVMTIVPQLQPLYLDERFPFLGGNRLYTVPVTLGYFKKPKKESELHEFPHPFL